MAQDNMESLRVAAVQMASENARVRENLKRATGLVESAAERGAELILLPEFMPTGYVYTTAIWEGAEPSEGPTVAWLEETSRRLGVWLGTSFLEADGEDFYNTFVLTDPDGVEAGRVRKQTPAIAEAFFFRGEEGSHVIDTPLGRIGVGICYENQLAYIPCTMYSQSVDIILMPHSAPVPSPNPFFPRRYTGRYVETLRDLARSYAVMLGIPIVFVNKAGPWKTRLPGLPLWEQDSVFPGLSAIADSDGTVKAQLSEGEGVLVEDVLLDPSRKARERPRTHGRWALEQPWVINAWRLVEAAGGAWYRFSGERRRAAVKISARQGVLRHRSQGPVRSGANKRSDES